MYADSRWMMHDFPEVFRTRDYIERGITRHSLYHSKRFQQVLPGVRMDLEWFDRRPVPAWADTDWLFDAQRLRAALLHYPDIAASHALAARLYGWPLPSTWLTSQLHVSATEPNCRIRLPGITLRRMTTMTVRQWFGLPILAPAEVIIGIAGDLTQRDLVKICDAAVGNWHGPPQIGLDELRDCVRTRPFLRGRQHLLKRPTSPVRLLIRHPRQTCGCGPSTSVFPNLSCILMFPAASLGALSNLTSAIPTHGLRWSTRAVTTSNRSGREKATSDATKCSVQKAGRSSA